MTSELFPTWGGFNGINFSNYFPNQRSYNSVVYVHKRFLNEYKESEKHAKKKGYYFKTLKNKDRKNIKHDKCQQFDSDKLNIEQFNKEKNINNNCQYNHESVLNQTIEFAKNLVPLIIPPEDSSIPVFYTVKAKKYKKKKEKVHRGTSIDKDLIADKRKVTKLNKKKEEIINHIESISVRESVTHSLQNTLDEININQTLSSTISEISERRIYHNKEKLNSKYNSDCHKFIISNSLEALATESIGISHGAKIKVHLMNETDKIFFTDSIKNPIISAIKDCISELYSANTETQSVRKSIKCNNEKLDHVLKKVMCIEKKLDKNNEIISIKSPKKEIIKAMTLEQLGEGVIDVIGKTTSEEIGEQGLRREEESKMYKNVRKESKTNDSFGCGEFSRSNRKSSVEYIGTKERPNRLPPKFCWTDTVAETVMK